MRTMSFFKRFCTIILATFSQEILCGQTKYYYDDTVACEVGWQLNSIIILDLVILVIAILFILNICTKVYDWFFPKGNPKYKHQVVARKNEEKTAKKESIIDKNQVVLDRERDRKKSAIDLGLSVMWADTNLFAKSIVDKGGKFAWGDKYNRTLSRYVDSFMNGKWPWELKKILGNDDLSICGNKRFDAATFLWGECWRLPQFYEINELIDKCEWEWTDIDGISGYRVIGQNGNYIFIPVTDEIVVDKDESIENGYYWTGIASFNSSEAKYLFFNKNIISAREKGERWKGMAIRPVWSPKIKTTEDILSQLESNAAPQENDVNSIYTNYCLSFELTERPKTNDIMRDLAERKMYSADGKKLLSTYNGAGGRKNEKIDLNPRPGTQIICDRAYNNYFDRFEKSVIIPESVLAIGNDAFMFLSPDCITIPQSVRYITGNPFETGYYNIIYCDTQYFKITDGELLSTDKTLYVANLDLKKNIKIIPEGVKIIGRNAISNHSEVELIKIPKTVIALAENAIAGCINLTAIIFEGKVNVIEPTAIVGCSNLKAIFVPTDLKNYYQCLLSQPLSELITELKDTSISEEEILLNIFVLEDKQKSNVIVSSKPVDKDTLKDDLEYINNIKIDYGLSIVTEEDWRWYEHVIDRSEKENEKHDDSDRGEASYSKDGKKFLLFEDFEENIEQYTIKNGVEILCDCSFADESHDEMQIILPNTLKIIGDFVFWKIDLGDFSIPASVMKITGNPFVSCYANLQCHSPKFCVEDGILYDKAKTRIISVLKDIEERIEDKKSITLPISVKEIGRNSFREFSFGGGTIVLPSSVIYIGDAAFYESAISQIILNDNIVEIGESAFAGTFIKRIDLPDTVIKLGESAFSHCENIEFVRLSSSLLTIEEETFSFCKELNHVHIPEGLKTIKKNAFSFCKRLTDIYLPDSLEKIEIGAFSGCGFKTIVVPKLTVIEEGAFMDNCRILRRI